MRPLAIPRACAVFAMAPPRVTEQANPLSADLDVLDATGIVRVMRCCDASLYRG